MTKKILKIVVICLCCALVIALSVVMVKKVVNDNRLEKYGSYECYDYHLVALKTTSTRASKIFISYSDIKDAPHEKFMSVCSVYWPSVMFSALISTYVYQNPDDYVDILNDWKISKIEVFSTGDGYDTDEPQIDLGDRVVATSIDSAVASELVEFIKNDGYATDAKRPAGYAYESFDKGQLRIRVHFEEAKYIVWESDISCYISDDGVDRRIELDKGKMSGKEPEKVSASVGELADLYDFLVNAAKNATSD